MQQRTRIAVIALAVVAALVCFVPLVIGALRSAHRPPVVITMPPGADNPPLPYASGKLSAPDSDSSSIGNDESAPAATPSRYAPAAAFVPPPSSAATGAMLYVHVSGAVRHPGVYRLADGSRVFNAVHIAGGALAKGDVDAINLAEKLEDGEKVVVPLKGANDDFEADTDTGDGVTTAADTVAPISEAASLKGRAHAGGGKRAKAKRAESSAASGAAYSGRHPAKITKGKIHINSASAAQFERLPGIGPAMAARIVEGRKALGGFQKITDLLYVRGLGQGKYKAIEPFLAM